MPACEPLDQLVRRDVDQLDFVGLLEHGVGQRLADDDAGDLGDDVVEAFDVLDVERRPDVDARVEQFLDVLPALGVPQALGVGVGQLVDEDQLRAAGERGVEIELAQRRRRGRERPACGSASSPSSSASVSGRPCGST